MKINPINNPNILKAYGKSKAAPTHVGKVAEGRDEVSFSQAAVSFSKALAEVRASVNQAPPADRQALLEDLSARIQSGQYQVSGEDVADKMIADILSRYKD